MRCKTTRNIGQRMGQFTCRMGAAIVAWAIMMPTAHAQLAAQSAVPPTYGAYGARTGYPSANSPSAQGAAYFGWYRAKYGRPPAPGRLPQQRPMPGGINPVDQLRYSQGAQPVVPMSPYAARQRMPQAHQAYRPAYGGYSPAKSGAQPSSMAPNYMTPGYRPQGFYPQQGRSPYGPQPNGPQQYRPMSYPHPGMMPPSGYRPPMPGPMPRAVPGVSSVSDKKKADGVASAPKVHTSFRPDCGCSQGPAVAPVMPEMAGPVGPMPYPSDFGVEPGTTDEAMLVNCHGQKVYTKRYREAPASLAEFFARVSVCTSENVQRCVQKKQCKKMNKKPCKGLLSIVKLLKDQDYPYPHAPCGCECEGCGEADCEDGGCPEGCATCQ